MRKLLALAVAVVVIACTSAFTRPPSPVTVSVVGDSVVITVSLADNTVSQTVTVDSVEFQVNMDNCASCLRTVRVEKQAGTTTARFAYPLSAWQPNQTRNGRIAARLAHVEEGVTAWSPLTQSGNTTGWSYTRVVAAPAAPELDKLTATSGTN